MCAVPQSNITTSLNNHSLARVVVFAHPISLFISTMDESPPPAHLLFTPENSPESLQSIPFGPLQTPSQLTSSPNHSLVEDVPISKAESLPPEPPMWVEVSHIPAEVRDEYSSIGDFLVVFSGDEFEEEDLEDVIGEYSDTKDMFYYVQVKPDLAARRVSL